MKLKDISLNSEEARLLYKILSNEKSLIYCNLYMDSFQKDQALRSLETLLEKSWDIFDDFMEENYYEE